MLRTASGIVGRTSNRFGLRPLSMTLINLSLNKLNHDDPRIVELGLFRNLGFNFLKDSN